MTESVNSEVDAGQSVLVARFHAFGDVLLVSPLLETLACSSRVGAVDVVTSERFGGMLTASPYVRRVFYVEGRDDVRDLHAQRYDVLLDLHTRSVPLAAELERILDAVSAATRRDFVDPWGTHRRAGAVPGRRYDEHAVECYARCAGELIDVPLAAGVLPIAAAAVAAADRRLPDDTVVLAPGARYPWKRWPAARYAALASSLLREGMQPVLAGHLADAPFVKDVAAELTVPLPVELHDEVHDLAAVMHRSRTVVANNSGMAHLAQVVGGRVVCIHSHTLPVMWRPWGAGHVDMVGTSTACGCTGMSEFEQATPCGKDIDPNVVAAAVAELLAVV